MLSWANEEVIAYFESWIEHLKYAKNLSENTSLSYKNDISLFIEFLHMFEGERITLEKLGSLDQREIRSWFAYRCRNGISHRSNARALSAVKNFFRYINKKGEIINESILLMSNRFKNQLLPRYLTEEEFDMLINAIPDLRNGWIAKRDVALCYFLYGTGLRISEALSIKVKDLKSEVIKITGKGGKERIFKLIPIVHRIIDEYMRVIPFDCKDDDFVFRSTDGSQLSRKSVAHFFISLRKKVNLPSKIRAHSLRHTFAVHLIQEGMGIRSLQELLGHSSLASTDIYTKLDKDTLIREYNKISLRDDEK